VILGVKLYPREVVNLHFRSNGGVGEVRGAVPSFSFPVVHFSSSPLEIAGPSKIGFHFGGISQAGPPG